MPVAYAILSRKWADRLHIHQFMVRKERRGSGVGDTLMSGLLERYSNDPVSLKVDRHNDGAIRFYSRYGFAMADVEDGNAWMWRNLGVRR
ncbi:MAG: GNAT family N-acetyltransferase [Pseudomonadota bacterium]